MLVDFAGETAAEARRPLRRGPRRDRSAASSLTLPAHRGGARRRQGLRLARARTTSCRRCRSRSASATRARGDFVREGGPRRGRPGDPLPERAAQGRPDGAGGRRPPSRRWPTVAGEVGHVPLRLQHQAAGLDGRHHHRADVPGAARAEEAARQPDPRRRAAGDGGDDPVPGRLARDGRARDHQPRREVAAEHPAGLPDPLDRLREPARRSSSSSTSRRTWSRPPTRSATRSPRCATSCRSRCASRSCSASTRRRSRSCSWRCRRRRRRHAEISRLAEDVLADRFRAIDGVAVVNVNGALRRELSVLLRAEKLREYNVSVDRGGERAARAEHHRAGGPRARARSTSRASASSAASSRRASSSTSSSSAAATRSCAWARSPRSQDGFAELAGFSLRNGNPNVGLSVTRSRDASTVTVAEQDPRRWSTRSTRRCPRAPSSRSRRTAARTRENSLNNVIEALIFGAGAHDLRGLRVPQLVALDADHGARRCRPR